MADEIDRAQQRDEYFRDLAIEEHYRRGIRNAGRLGVGECVDCGADIPEARRKAVPGCTRCVTCQEALEIHSHWRAL